MKPGQGATHRIRELEVENDRLREALINARIFIVNYSDRKYRKQAANLILKLHEALLDRHEQTLEDRK